MITNIFYPNAQLNRYAMTSLYQQNLLYMLFTDDKYMLPDELSLYFPEVHLTHLQEELLLKKLEMCGVKYLYIITTSNNIVGRRIMKLNTGIRVSYRDKNTILYIWN